MRDLISKVLAKDFLSLEDQTGNAREIEFVSYYRLTDFGQLLKAVEMIEQEQWELKLAKSEQNLAQGSIRVRREQSRDGQNVRFYETLKTVVPGSAGRDELTREIDESYFNAFKSTMSRGMLKLRCVIPIEGTEGTWPEDKCTQHKGALCWEIDVFYAENGKDLFPWVKVDLEVPDESWLQKLPEFPLSHERAITAPYGQRTEEDEALVSSFYSGPFIYTHEREAAMKAATTPATSETDPTEEPAQTEPETNTDKAGTSNDSNS